jgi:hypothetical protein
MFLTILKSIFSIVLLTVIILTVGVLLWLLSRNSGFALYSILYIIGCFPLLWVALSFGGSEKSLSLSQFGKSSTDVPNNAVKNDVFSKDTLFSTLNSILASINILLIAGILDYLSTI